LLVEQVSKRFARFPALNSVSLDVETGEFLALLGPSGSGKTTLLRVVAGLETPDAGSVHFDGEDFLALSPRERRVGMVFQHYALFRHMTVAKNIAFGLSVRPPRQRPSRRAIGETVERLLALIQLDGLGDRYPAQLSGGQQQRVALARALVPDPAILVADEPTGNLDEATGKQIVDLLFTKHAERGMTLVLVTHDTSLAQRCDRVVRLRSGRIEAPGAERKAAS
jgi:sulfate/thiosulfate transport system ATP-binding protein